MKAGDWVYSYSQGLWKILRVERIESIIPFPINKTTVFSKRLLNNKGKRSFSIESCDQRFISPLDITDLNKVEQFLADNPNVENEFEEYDKPIDSILNMSLYCKDGDQKEEIIELAEREFNKISSGLSDVEIEKIWDDKFSEYLKSSIRNMTVQFKSPSTIIDKNKILYKQIDFLDF